MGSMKNRRKPKREPMVDGYGGFLFLDKNGRPMDRDMDKNMKDCMPKCR